MQGRGDGELQALRVAFDALLPLADPLRQASILRTGLRALIIADDHGALHARHSPPAPPLRPIRNSAASVWPELRSRLRAVLIKQHGKLATDEIADAVGISRSRCRRILCPSAVSPSAALLAALRCWLETRSSPGSGSSRPESGFSTPKTGLSQRQRVSLRPEEGDPDPHRLTMPQREKLAAQLELDPKAIREAGLSVDIAEKAVSGQSLEPPIVQRLSAFLSSATAAGK